MGSRPILLASESPRRHELLSILRLPFDVQSEVIDETALEHESPTDLVQRLAVSKAEAVAIRNPCALVIGADTIVVVDSAILGKPKDAKQAADFLSRLQGRSHQVFTGVALLSDELQDVRVSSTEVFFREMSYDEIDAYIATGEPLDKAGAYAIQGIGATLIRRIEGDYFTVVGLPLGLLSDMLTEAGQPVLTLERG
ncbi:MAG: maf protein [Bacilli bacterium]|nr:maf protein [Bacilli bacterium]